MFGFITDIFGKIMNYIFEFLSLIGIKNVGANIVISTILFTIIVYTLLLPFTIKQQKFTRISAIMNPEIQAIQKKYKGKNDQVSMLKMQEETKLVYSKYGTSPTSGCLGSLIQLPFLFALWPVMQNIPKYVTAVSDKKEYSVLGIVISSPKGAATPMSLFETKNVWLIIVAISIPVLAGFTQWLSVKVSQSITQQKNKKDEGAMVQQMGMMMKIMPLMSVFMSLYMQILLGLYWIISAVVRIVQQIIINRILDKKTIDVLIEENKQKAAKKNAKKKEVDPSKVNSMAQIYTKKLDEMKANADNQNSNSNSGSSTYQSNAKPGSLAAKANMVRDYNNRNNK